MIDVPPIRQEGYTAMWIGSAMRSPQHPGGFCFCPYKDGAARENFLVGCIMAAFRLEAR